MVNKKLLNTDTQVLRQAEGSMFYKSSPMTFANAKALRNKQTSAELIFWSLLKQNFPGIRFKRQHPISEYIADFYCHKFKLVIEIDGAVHLSEEAKINDKIRDDYMQSLELRIIRFTNEEVCRNGEHVVKKLKDIIVL
ncbi:MAG: endonuclease domain-containing protein [Ginsengibacter sp.]